MRPPSTCRTILLGAALVLAGAGPAAPDDDDHDRALRALQDGLAKPLTEILESVRSEVEGDIISVHFEREDDRWIYDFKVITPAGKLQEIQVDALTAAILKREDD